jgi:hypothetical protein
LPPTGSFTILAFSDWYRVVSFAFVSVFIVVLITRLKSQAPPKPVREPQSRIQLHGVAAGAD